MSWYYYCHPNAASMLDGCGPTWLGLFASVFALVAFVGITFLLFVWIRRKFSGISSLGVEDVKV